MLTISPITMVPVCRTGDAVRITCTASVEFISWSILQQRQGTLERISNDQTINSRDASQMTQVEVNSVLFTFMRTSARGASPLISTLSIDSVNNSLNGTVVRCSDVANPMTSASTRIQIIDASQSELAYYHVQHCARYYIHNHTRHPIHSNTE